MLPEEILKEKKQPGLYTYRKDAIDKITKDSSPINASIKIAYLEKFFPGYPYMPYYRKKIKLFERK